MRHYNRNNKTSKCRCVRQCKKHQPKQDDSTSSLTVIVKPLNQQCRPKCNRPKIGKRPRTLSWIQSI